MPDRLLSCAGIFTQFKSTLKITIPSSAEC